LQTLNHDSIRAPKTVRRHLGHRVSKLAPACLALSAALTAPAHAQVVAPGDQFMLAYSPHVIHFHYSPDHVDWNNFVALELQTDRTRVFNASRATFGISLFDNSFGQFSQYVYWGQIWDVAKVGPGTMFGKVTAGLLNGYKPPYDDKIPFNKAGIAPAIVPSIGYRYNENLGAELALLGNNGLLFAVSWTFAPQQ
jgi:hypothetical protein